MTEFSSSKVTREHVAFVAQKLFMCPDLGAKVVKYPILGFRLFEHDIASSHI